LNNAVAHIRHGETGKISHTIILNTRNIETITAEFIRQRPSGALVNLTYERRNLANSHTVHLNMGDELILLYSESERILVTYDQRRSLFVIH